MGEREGGVAFRKSRESKKRRMSLAFEKNSETLSLNLYSSVFILKISCLAFW
jgi:hypothetical protein